MGITAARLFVLVQNRLVFYIIHRFLETSAGKKNLALHCGKRRPKRRMHVADIVTLNLVQIFDRTGELKTFHKNTKSHYRSYFQTPTNYENFMKASNRSAGFIAAFVQHQLCLDRMRCPDSVFYVGSTPVFYVGAAIFRPIKLQKVSLQEENRQKAGSMASALMTARRPGSCRYHRRPC